MGKNRLAAAVAAASSVFNMNWFFFIFMLCAGWRL
jgi:hypothetical protein